MLRLYTSVLFTSPVLFPFEWHPCRFQMECS